VLWRAFDKGVRMRPPVVAADAALMQIQWREGEVSRCAGAVRRSAQDDTARPRAGEFHRMAPRADQLIDNQHKTQWGTGRSPLLRVLSIAWALH